MKRVLVDHVAFVQTVQSDVQFNSWVKEVSPEVVGIQRVWLQELFLILKILWEIYQLLRKYGIIKFWWETRKVTRALAREDITARELALMEIRNRLQRK